MSIVISAKWCLFCFLIYGVVVSYHIFYTIMSFRQLWYIKLFYAFSFMSVCFQFSISNLHSSTLLSIINRFALVGGAFSCGILLYLPLQFSAAVSFSMYSNVTGILHWVIYSVSGFLCNSKFLTPANSVLYDKVYGIQHSCLLL